MPTSAQQTVDRSPEGRLRAGTSRRTDRHPYRHAGAWAAILLLLGALTAFAPRAAAAEIEGAITSITTTATHTSKGDRVDFGCTWAVPDGSRPGDTFTLRLPDELRWFGSRSFAIASPDGEPVATATVDDSGLVVFTLTDYVLTHPVEVHGTCQFSTLYAVEGTGEIETVRFEVGAEVIPVDIDTEGPCTQGCDVVRDEASKSMWWYDEQQTVTRSVVRAPATTRETSTVTLTDVPQPGLAIDCTSLVTRVGKHLNASGDVTTPTDDARYPAVVQCSPERLVVTWKDLPAGEYAELRVSSTVTDPTLTSFRNDATVTINGEDTPVTAQVRTSEAGGTGSGTPTSPTPTTTTPPTTTSTTTSATTPPTSTTSTSSTTTSPAPVTTQPSVTATTGGGTLVRADVPEDNGSAESRASLAFTGSNTVTAAAAALCLLLVGLALTLVARRARLRNH
jgi:hypothetical protein